MRAIEQLEQQNTQSEVKEAKTEKREKWMHKESGITVAEVDNGKFILVLGNQMICEKEFATKKDAIQYIKVKPWDLMKYYIAELSRRVYEKFIADESKEFTRIMQEAANNHKEN